MAQLKEVLESSFFCSVKEVRMLGRDNIAPHPTLGISQYTVKYSHIMWPFTSITPPVLTHTLKVNLLANNPYSTTHPPGVRACVQHSRGGGQCER